MCTLFAVNYLQCTICSKLFAVHYLNIFLCTKKSVDQELGKLYCTGRKLKQNSLNCVGYGSAKVIATTPRNLITDFAYLLFGSSST